MTNGTTVTDSMSITHVVFEEFISRLKSIFSGPSNVTRESVTGCIDSVDKVIHERLNDQLDSRIRDSNLATSKDIELVRKDIDLVRIDMNKDLKLEIFQSKISIILWMTGTMATLLGMTVTILLWKLK